MNTALGLCMLPCVALLSLAGMASWVALIEVSIVFALIAVTMGVPINNFGVLPIRVVGLLEHDLLQALPLYVLMGCIWYRLPLAQHVVASFTALISRMGVRRAAESLALLATAALFAPVNGSVGASVSMLSKLFGVKADAPRLAMMATFGTLGVVVPPSLVLVLLGDAMMRAHTEALNITQQQTQIINTQMLMQGALLPAALLIVGYALCLVLLPKATLVVGPAKPTLTLKQALSAVVAVVVIIGLLSAVASGAMFAVEAAASAAMATLGYALLTRALPLVAWREALDDALSLTGALFALLLGATTFSLVFRSLGTDQWLATHITQSNASPAWLMLGVMAFIALCALALDAFEIVFVVVPIVMPPLLQVVPDATWVAVLTLLVLQLSYLVPPLGLALLLARQQASEPLRLSAWVRLLAPFICIQLAVIAAVCVVPGLVSQASHTSRDDAVKNPDAIKSKLNEDEVIKAMREGAARESSK